MIPSAFHRVTRRAAGFSLLELMVSMAVLSVLVVFLAELFATTAGSWVQKIGSQEAEMEVQIARQWLTEDLSAAYTNRPLRSSGTSHFAGTFEQGRFFRDRLIVPFEVDRESGYGASKAIVNAAPEFSSLSFVALRRDAGSILPETFSPERFGALGNPALEKNAYGETAFFAAADTYLVGYYVAYTRDSELPGSSSSLKLYRHSRPCGTSNGQSQASTILRYQSNVLSEELLPLAQFRNEELPFLFAFRTKNALTIEPESAVAPWPKFADPEDLVAKPPSTNLPDGGLKAWHDPENAVHDFLRGDEPVATNVVRFEAKAFRRVEILDADGQVDHVELMNARRLNTYLSLGGGDEWPALIVPSFVEITLAVIGPEAAAPLEERSDWIMSWGEDDLPTGSNPVAKRLIERSLRTVRFRVPILHAS